MNDRDDLITLSRWAEENDLLKSTVFNWMERYPTFPLPFERHGRRFKLYRRKDLDSWYTDPHRTCKCNLHVPHKAVE